MGIFYKIKDDGNSVYVMKTLFNSGKIRNKNDIEKFKEISVEEFLSKIPKSVRSKFLAEIERVREIKNKRLFHISVVTVDDTMSTSTRVTYNINGKIFREDNGEKLQYSQRKDAIQYCKKLYGDKFIEKYGYILNGSEEGVFCFIDRELDPDSKEYDRLTDEYRSLTKIQDLKQQINKYKMEEKQR